MDERIAAVSGVDYGKLNPFKDRCLEGCRRTMEPARMAGVDPFEQTLGQTAFLTSLGSAGILATVNEGLGTANLVAELARELGLTPEQVGQFFSAIGVSTLAMAANDLAVCGATPLTAQLHVAVGDADTLAQEGVDSIIRGWEEGCNLIGCAWGGGETPELRGIVQRGTMLLSGSMTGIIREQKHWMRPDRLTEGAVMVGLPSNGVHANGWTAIREKVLPRLGTNHRLSDGTTLIEALLRSTYLYWPIIRFCQREGIELQYAANITGGGWQKIDRANQPFRYEITKLPKQQMVFRVIAAALDLDKRAMYAAYNMGLGFVLFMKNERDANLLIQKWGGAHYPEPMIIGSVRRNDDAQKSVVEIQPLGIRYERDVK